MSVTSMGEARRNRGHRAGSRASAGPPLTAFVTSWQLALEAATKSPRTIRSYLDSVKALHAFLTAQGMPSDVEGVDAQHIRAFLLVEEERTSAVSAAVHFRNLRVFFGWLAHEEERSNPNPMSRVEGPKVAEVHRGGHGRRALLLREEERAKVLSLYAFDIRGHVLSGQERIQGFDGIEVRADRARALGGGFERELPRGHKGGKGRASGRTATGSVPPIASCFAHAGDGHTDGLPPTDAIRVRRALPLGHAAGHLLTTNQMLYPLSYER